eukprot:183825_1
MAGRKRSRDELCHTGPDPNKENEPAFKAMRLNDKSRKNIPPKILELNDKPASVWKCTVCTFDNTISATKCDMCEQPHAKASPCKSNDMLSKFLCISCSTHPGYDLPCSHKLCLSCASTYIINGIESQKWKSVPLQCPSNLNKCNNSILPHWLIKQCTISKPQLESLEKQQNAYNALIAKLCVICKAHEGKELQCEHNVCITCCKRYILDGIASDKWTKQSLCCPEPNCRNGKQLPNYMINECGFSDDIIKQIESMQNTYIRNTNPSLTECPKCGTTYSTEIGDINCTDSKDERLSFMHKQHKTQFRFRCSKIGCKAIFCKKCKAIPYHSGYSCDEYKAYIAANKCRFCGVQLNTSNTAKKDDTLQSGLDYVCIASECMAKRDICCDLQHAKCGHNCIGLRGYDCDKCLSEKCVSKNADFNDNDFCNICWVDPLNVAPCIGLTCRHYFHFECLKNKIERKWPSPRITFGFLNCPLCKTEMRHPALNELLKDVYAFKEKITKDAIQRVKIEGLQNDKRLTDPKSIYYNKLGKYAMDRLAFYMCSKCKKPYFGGMKKCEEAGLEREEDYKQEHLICGSCSAGSNKQKCNTHGTEYISYKCKFCCSIAVWFCWGTTHFCDPCHRKATTINKAKIKTLPKCPGKKKCPLNVDHPANGTKEFCLGCVVCLRK